MIRIGHVMDVLRTMPDHSVHCVVTSPPYYGLRDYGLEPVIWEPVVYAPMPGLPEMAFPVHTDPSMFPDCDHDWNAWTESHDVREKPIAGKTRTTDRHYGDASRKFDGNHQKHAHGQFCRKCGAWRGCLGLEPTPDLYIGHLVQVFRELRRVLRPDGTLWLNLGDSYSNGGRKTRDSDDKLTARGMDQRPADLFGIKPKDLMGIPWRAAFALQADGWWLRSDIVWAKTNAMPESVADRPTRSHEMVFLLTPSERYFYDHIAVMEPAVQSGRARKDRMGGNKYGEGVKHSDGSVFRGAETRNRRSVWTISTKPYKGAHFAVFPPDLVEPMIRAGTSEAGCCPQCGKPWVRVTERSVAENPAQHRGSSFHHGKTRAAREALSSVGEGPRTASVMTVGWKPDCLCPVHAPLPCVVLDPFGGSGTTAMVARRLGRNWEIIEGNPNYALLVEDRLRVPATKGERAAQTMRHPQAPIPAQTQLEIFDGEHPAHR